MNTREVHVLIKSDLRVRDTELVLELSLSCPSHSDLVNLIDLSLDSQRMGAARVGPHVRERDFLRRATLEEKLAVGWTEEEH